MACTTLSDYLWLSTFLTLSICASQALCCPLTEEDNMLRRHEEWMALHKRIYKTCRKKKDSFPYSREMWNG
ncbi:hypothetical protein SLA2020_429790 [Shorea laevis]